MSRPEFLVCDGTCRCRDHITPGTHIPVCPRHGQILRRIVGDHRRGVCPDCYHLALRVLNTRPRYTPEPVSDYPAEQWAWTPRDLFDGADLPPANGMQPLDLTWME